MIAVNATLGIAALVGVASGADAAIWGMYKDAAHEGFFLPRFFRSILLGSAAAVAIQAALSLSLPDAGSILLLFGLAYAVERVLVEGWKTFVRNADQSKYAIPMQFAVKGVPVRSRSARLLAGTATLLTIAVATSENYKTFFFPSRPRGKFAGKPIAFPSMLRVRHRFVPAYALIRLGMVWLVADLVIPDKNCAATSSYEPGLSQPQSEVCP